MELPIGQRGGSIVERNGTMTKTIKVANSNVDRCRKNLLTEFPKDTVGVWTIYGEDSNCDLGGFHSEPLLEVVYGTYKNVVEYAIGLDGFFAWGSGGRIVRMKEKTEIRNIDVLFSEKGKKLVEEKDQLLKRLAEIDKELK
jgi:hypothetical protein